VRDSDEGVEGFMESGIFRLDEANAFFVDPVRILNRSHTRFRVSPHAYYSRSFSHSDRSEGNSVGSLENSRKRKSRGMDKKKITNSREQMAEQRHQDVRLLLLKAHEAFLAANREFGILHYLKSEIGEFSEESVLQQKSGVDFVELGSTFQAPLYDIVLKVHEEEETSTENGGQLVCNERVLPLFNNLVSNENNEDIEAVIMGNTFFLPKRSSFYMSDLRDIHNLVPAKSDEGFNLIVIDPPWENSSAHQKMKYRTLPNRYFLSLPINRLAHTDGALVALWVTNREKLRIFVETELFPKWGTKHVATSYWLKVKPDGSLISELDLFHHRPYECLLLGFCSGGEGEKSHDPETSIIRHNQIFISIPGDYSRKPPIGALLAEYMKPKTMRCIELFSRELISGWTCWGNEPLHFQHSNYFL
ncbi:hypothetical protein M569_14315, partial [Genlisea aurea]